MQARAALEQGMASPADRRLLGPVLAELDRALGALDPSTTATPRYTSQERSVSPSPDEVEALRREVERIRGAVAWDRRLLDAVLNESPHGVIVCDANGRLILQNRATERIWAGTATADDVEGWGQYRAFHPDGRPFAASDWSMARCLSNGETVQAEEIHVQRFDGTHAFLLGSCAPIKDEGGALLGAISVFADITAFKIARDRLELLAQGARLVMELAADPERLLRALARLLVPLVASANSVRLLSADGLRFETVASAHADPARDPLLEEVCRVPLPRDEGLAALVAERGEVVLFPEVSPDWFRAHTPAAFWPKAEALPVRSLLVVPIRTRGRLLGLFVLVRSEPGNPFEQADAIVLQELADRVGACLEQARTLRAERRARENASFLADATAALASSLDPDAILGRIADIVVPRFADWCAAELGEGDQARLLGVVHRDPARMALAEALRVDYPREAGQHPCVLDVRRPDAPLLLAHVSDEDLAGYTRDEEHLALLRALGSASVLLLPLQSGSRTIGALTLVRGPSERPFDSADLECGGELARRAALAMENARLYAEARHAVELRDEFLTMAGHELRTPLTVLSMQLQSLQRAAGRDPAAARLADKLARASSAAGRLDRLIGDLLDVSRISAGRLRLEPEEVDARGLMDEVATRFAETAAAAGSPLFISGARGLRGTWDRSRIDQVLSNLVSNAIKYGRGRPVELAVRGERGGVCFSVRDHGIGVAPEQQERIFDRFERAVGVHEFGGLGLGLWIAREIVTASGGSISVESQRGQGATFTVRLPLEPSAEIGPETLPVTAPLAARAQPARGG